jgi:hypothetical protein
MSLDTPKFLSPLPAHRAEFLSRIAESQPSLLEAFDTQVLGGYSPEQAVKYERSSPAPLVDLRQQGNTVYHELTRTVSNARGQQREEVLYRLRATLLNAQSRFEEEDSQMADLATAIDSVHPQRGDTIAENILGLGLFAAESRLRTLRTISESYRQVFEVMVDLVREQYEPAGSGRSGI